jgi:hypothetical protein
MSAASADDVQTAAIDATATDTILLITHTPREKCRTTAVGMVTDLHFLLSRFIESFKLKGC